MTVSSGFFNSVSGDRKYDAEDFGEVFDGIIGDGVHRGIGTELTVTAMGGSTLRVGPGRVWFDKTWLLNDDNINIEAIASHPAQPRIDAVIVEIDRSSPVRMGTIKYKTGTAGTTPARPDMVHTDTLNQYALAYVSRAASSGTILQAHITPVVGTPETPYATSKLLDNSFEPSWMHRNVFRGKNLGTSLTTAQKTMIASGSFEDLYVGDYWVINGHVWRIVDINYYLNRGMLGGDNALQVSRNHVMVMPDKCLLAGRMNNSSDKANAGGYVNSDFRGSQLPSLRTMIANAFGELNLLTYSEYFVNGLTGNRAGSVQAMDVKVELPSMVQIAGSPFFAPGPDSSGGFAPRADKVGTNQLALFRLVPQFMRAAPNSDILPPGGVPWQTTGYYTNDPVTQYMWACITAGAAASYVWSHGDGMNFRPLFGLIGNAF